MFKVFTNDQLSNDAYHDPEGWAAEYVSGSSLAEIFNTCPANWRFKKNEITKALEFGTQSHTNFESKALFEASYKRCPHPKEFKDLITSQSALAAKLKSFGLKGTSGKQYPDLIRMMVDCGEMLNVQWLIEMIAEAEARAEGKKLVDAEAYDACVTMRQVLENIPEHNACINSPTAMHEVSIFGVISGVKVKVRLDHLDFAENVQARVLTGFNNEGEPEYEDVIYPEALVITDFKTTQSANPMEFPRLAFNHGYYLKMSLQHDLLKRAIQAGAFEGVSKDIPIIVRLLAQEKKEPYLPLAYRMTMEQIRIGRQQYISVVHTFKECLESDVWPSYANGAAEVELETPKFVRYQYDSRCSM
ncbi:exonuclease VIII [Escherichia phage vB_EcoS_IME347]|uniref:Putative exodeoxyribonuclease VIII n=1 Tax=Escherichia phage vB_EcoS_IME347 TaxID=2496546 RepID=A0A2S1GSD0_9CAUD|nr:exonuclease VIII [Escherichia phage vB_EcoS_IME347]AWD92256.1 putative exodeoxyribonuclease VIII [Escherichia phage vB_EcoS_IME347]